MRKYRCVIDNFIYDEAVGDPASGLAAGTKFADIPATWECPDCGASKEDFELIEG